jgi:hypothetical protein
MPRMKLCGVVFGSCLASVVFAGTAFACTKVSLAVAPVPISSVPVKACVTQNDVPVNECVTTPAGQTVSLTVNATADTPTSVVKPPTIVPKQCPLGTQGVAAEVFTGSASTTISGVVSVTANDGRTDVPVKQYVAAPGQTVKIYACAGLA